MASTVSKISSTVHGRKSIGRPRSFDEEKVLEVVLQEFWRLGYDGTTFAHLTAATGLHKGSLYQAFGDKKALFIKILNYYLDKVYNEVMASVNPADPPLEQLCTLLHAIVNIHLASDTETCRSGCLAINTMVENAPQDEKIQAVLEAGYTKRLNTLSRLITEAQESGQIKRTLPPPQLAEMLCAMMSGLAATMKGPLSQEQAHRLTDDFLMLLQ